MSENNSKKSVENVLVTVYHKEPVLPLLKELKRHNVNFYSTGGTLEFMKSKGIDATSIESVTSYPSIFDGRVKTLHPKIFGSILSRKDSEEHQAEAKKYNIPSMDMVIVDLYPFESTVNSGASFQEILEKIDIGGISLIRAAAKNFNDVLIISSAEDYEECKNILERQDGCFTSQQRKDFAVKAFNVSSHYDMAIYNYLSDESPEAFKASIKGKLELRYGENPHQRGLFYGNLDNVFHKIQGKQLSYNNLLDIDSAVNLINEFEQPTFAIIKHNNACGVASAGDITSAYKKALSSNPVAAFGGILISNRNINADCAYHINNLFFEVIIAPGYDEEAIKLLGSKKNRNILELKDDYVLPKTQYRSAINGVLMQDCDSVLTTFDEWNVVTEIKPTEHEILDLAFANKIVKHTKSNAIVLAKDNHLLGAGTGQTSRVDALKQAIDKAKEFKLDLNGAVMASDAFFPFPDCVEIAYYAGIKSVIQPGGSIKDKESIDFCNKYKMSMVLTGIRHFKH